MEEEAQERVVNQVGFQLLPNCLPTASQLPPNCLPTAAQFLWGFCDLAIKKKTIKYIVNFS